MCDPASLLHHSCVTLHHTHSCITHVLPPQPAAPPAAAPPAAPAAPPAAPAVPTPEEAPKAKGLPSLPVKAKKK